MIVQSPTWDQGAKFLEYVESTEDGVSVRSSETMDLLIACLRSDDGSSFTVDQIKAMPFPEVLEAWQEIQLHLQPKKKATSEKQPSISVLS